jgi:hypothetical protein
MPPKAIENRKMYHNAPFCGTFAEPQNPCFPISIAFRSIHHPCFPINIASRTNIAAPYRLCTSVVRSTYYTSLAFRAVAFRITPRTL